MIRSLLASALLAAAPTVVFTISDDRIVEASGLAPGIRSPGVVYVQNDSGDTNRVFAVSKRTGRTLATITVPGVRNVDWEDLAVARDAAGVPSLWIADTGNNGGSRDELQVYRVAEPLVADDPDDDADDESVTTAAPDVWRINPPGTVSDFESLAVAPGGRPYLVDKSLLGDSTVYALPSEPDAARARDLTTVATITFAATGTSGGPAILGRAAQRTATGAAFSADGTIFAVRTYTDAYVWRVRGGDLLQALAGDPARVALPEQPQGEGIAVDGSRLLVDSEGDDQPVYAVALPAAAPAGSAGSASSASSASSTPASPSASIDPSEPDEGDRSGRDNSRYLIGGAVVIVLGLIVVLVSRRRR